MRSIFCTLAIVAVVPMFATAQTKIKDGTIVSSALPNSDAILELESNNKGLLMPRVALTSVTSPAPLSAHIAGISVFNTASNASVVPGVYYNDGTRWQLMVNSTMPSANIYNSNGSLTGSRTVTLNGNLLRFLGASGYLQYESTGRIFALNGTGNNSVTFRLNTEDADEDGSRATFDMQLIPDNTLQMHATGGTTSINFGTHLSLTSAPIRFLTSPGGGAAGLERMRIDGEGNIGIGGITSPSQKLDISGGNIRIRDINSNAGAATDKMVVADANGVLKTLAPGAYTLFHAKLTTNRSMTANTVSTLLYDAPISTSPLYTYNAANGTLTFTQPGNYLINMQTSFCNIANAGAQLTIGVRLASDNSYLGRGTHYTATVLGANVGELMTYTTMLIVPSAGYQVRFVAVSNNNCTVLATEAGGTGSGNVTNVTIQKI